MSNPLLLKSFTAAVAIPPFRLVRLSALDTVTLATASTDALIGVNSDVAPAIGERCDVVLQGIAFVEAGAAIPQGVMLTSDGTGRAINAVPAAGVNARVVGVAMEAAVAAGDVIRVLLEPGAVQG